MTSNSAGVAGFCGEQNCDERPNRPNHPLCYSHYQASQDGVIDECPNHTGVYKPSEYPVCRRCYSQTRQPVPTAVQTNFRQQPPDDSKGWNRQPPDEPAAALSSPVFEAVKLVRRNMTAHESVCVNHESNTIQFLTMPMLSGLGWNVYDPEQVIMEYKPAGKQRYRQAIAVDITLFENGSPKIFVEAKRLDREYVPEYEEQLGKYASFLGDGGIAALTNGRHWLVYAVTNGKPQHRLTINMAEGAAEDAASELYNIIGRAAVGNAVERAAPKQTPPRPEDIAESLRQYREREGRLRRQPAYTIFNNETIDLIATQQPTDLRQLGNIRGVGPSILQQHGSAIITIVRGEG